MVFLEARSLRAEPCRVPRLLTVGVPTTATAGHRHDQSPHRPQPEPLGYFGNRLSSSPKKAPRSSFSFSGYSMFGSDMVTFDFLSKRAR